MRGLNGYTSLLTDRYELTMAQTYLQAGLAEKTARFEYFFRSLPFNGGYLVFAGLQDLLEAIVNFRFGEQELKFLKEEGFSLEFLEYLRGFRFQGDIYSVKEGEIVFPIEPLIIVEGNLVETQVIETLLLNIINFQSLIATKAKRAQWVAGSRLIADFGLRRAHGLGGIQASRASIIGGCSATSNLMAGLLYGVRTVGTMAHSFVLAFPDELTAFREYAKANPDDCILLIDTYDTLNSGVPNAITIAKEMERSGRRLKGVRIDSGDLAYLSRKVRERLDAEGLDYVKIVVSNQLDEFVIRSLIEQKAPIDFFGVGTRLITGQPDSALDGVYKLTVLDDQPKMKISDTLTKATLPGKKKVLRCRDEDGNFLMDVICLEDEPVPEEMYHPFEPTKHCRITGKAEPLLFKVMEKGRIIQDPPTVYQIAEYCNQRFSSLPDEHKRFEYPHT